MQVAPGTIAIWSDVHCPWAHVAVWRLWDARRRLRLDDRVSFDHRIFPLELFNSEPTPFRTLSAEVPVCGRLAPRAGWQVWQRPLTEWPVSTLLPMEAVQAARAQSSRAAEELDRGLRVAFFAESRCISLRHVILEVANECQSVDVAALAAALDAGTFRGRIVEDWEAAKREGVRGSPHVFLADGTDVQNPGVSFHWEGELGLGFPVVDGDDPSVYDELVRRAATA